ncbi:MAG: secondary thiamine-phosphate synthase enzyme YjbQ [Candidatus Nanoarchaeia archaeon]
MHELQIKTNAHSEMLDITAHIARMIPKDMQDGLCHVYSTHTTAGITINENADPSVVEDILKQLDKMVPWRNNYSHCEGNSAAHIKASLLGFSQTVPIKNGQLLLGTWQGIYFCEFDGPRQRRIIVTFLKGKE